MSLEFLLLGGGSLYSLSWLIAAQILAEMTLTFYLGCPDPEWHCPEIPALNRRHRIGFSGDDYQHCARGRLDTTAETRKHVEPKARKRTLRPIYWLLF